MYITDPTEVCLSELCVYDYSFNGGPGTDFVADLTLPDIDFNTHHLYPQVSRPPLHILPGRLTRS
jgi:hypothetical protein